MLAQFFIFGAPVILLILVILFRKRIAVFSGTLLKITLSIFIGGIGGLIWLRPLFRCAEGDLGVGCLVRTATVAPVIMVVGSLFIFAILESILKKPQQLQPQKPSRFDSLFSIFALLFALIAGMILFTILSDYRLPGFETIFYTMLIVPFITVVSTVLIFVGLKKVFRKITKI